MVGEALVLGTTKVAWFRFCGDFHGSIGARSVSIPVSPAYFLPLAVDVVSLVVPLFLGLFLARPVRVVRQQCGKLAQE